MLEEKVKFVTMFGEHINIDKWVLSKEKVTKAANKHFGETIVVCPCFFGSSCVCVGWRCWSMAKNRVVGYMPISVGQFRHYPDDFAESGGVHVMVPLTETWAEVMDAQVRFLHDEIQIKFEA